MTSTEPSEDLERVFENLDRLESRMLDALSQAIQIQSVNPKYPGQNYDELVGGESKVNDFVAELYEEAGASVEKITVEAGRSNIVGVCHGEDPAARSLILNGHVDVVPPGDPSSWSVDPFSGVIKDGRIWGRGAVDEKSGVIAHAFAAIALREAGVSLPGRLILQSVVGEEMGDHECGTSAVMQAGYTADAAVICEATFSQEKGPTVAPATAGLLWFSVTVRGKQAHSGLRGITIHPTLEGPDLGVNAIDKLFPIYEALRALESEWAYTRRHEHFVPGHFGILPGAIRGNPWGVEVPFSLADSATIEYAIYHSPSSAPEEVKAEIEERIARVGLSDPWLREHPPEIEWKMEWAPISLSSEHDLVETVRRSVDKAGVSGRATPLAGFFGVCDASWMTPFGIDGVVFGPGNGRLAHAADESLDCSDLLTAARAYAAMAIDWCSASDHSNNGAGSSSRPAKEG